MKTLIAIFFTLSPYAHASKKILLQCQDFQDKIESNLIISEQIKDFDPSLHYPFHCMLKTVDSPILRCVVEKNFQHYVDDISLKISNLVKLNNLLNDELLKCSFFMFHYIRLLTDLREGEINYILKYLPDFKDLMEKDNVNNGYIKSVLSNPIRSMYVLEYIDSLNLKEWPSQIKLNEILNEHLTTRYKISKDTHIDFIKLMLDQEQIKRKILAD